MRFAAAVSTQEGVAGGRELIERVGPALDGRADLVLLFLTGHLRDAAAALAEVVRDALHPAALIGCTCEGVIGADQEVEQVPGISLLAGQLPGVTLRPFHIGMEEWPALLADDERLQQRIGTGEEHRAQLVLGDPFTTPADELLQALDRVFPGRPTLGGMASGADRAGENVLLLNDQVYPEGAVGVGLGGDVRVDAVVSQGCRPVGRPLIITRAEENLILELGRRPALQAAEEMLSELPEAERALLRSGLFVGMVIDEYKEAFARGDFLVRGLMGVDPESGALAVDDLVRPGQSIQFHVRDAATADEDLRLLLQPQRDVGPPPAGGLIFSCNGRGLRMFEQPHHDVRTALEILPRTPLAGFFAAGELGPIGGKCFIHGYTASIALFRPSSSSTS
jgi:small ligand-binding sensory domain FIST